MPILILLYIFEDAGPVVLSFFGEFTDFFLAVGGDAAFIPRVFILFQQFCVGRFDVPRYRDHAVFIDFADFDLPAVVDQNFAAAHHRAFGQAQGRAADGAEKALLAQLVHGDDAKLLLRALAGDGVAEQEQIAVRLGHDAVKGVQAVIDLRLRHHAAIRRLVQLHGHGHGGLVGKQAFRGKVIAQADVVGGQDVQAVRQHRGGDAAGQQVGRHPQGVVARRAGVSEQLLQRYAQRAENGFDVYLGCAGSAPDGIDGHQAVFGFPGLCAGSIVVFFIFSGFYSGFCGISAERNVSDCVFGSINGGLSRFECVAALLDDSCRY